MTHYKVSKEITPTIFKTESQKTSFLMKKVVDETSIESFFTLNHPNVIQIVDTHKDDDKTFLVLECCDKFLFEIIGMKLSDSFIFNVIRQTLDALLYLHQNFIYNQGFTINSIVFKGPSYNVKFFDFFEKTDKNVYCPLRKGDSPIKGKTSLKSIIKDDILCQYYQEYLKKRFCEENLLFLEDIKRYKEKEQISDEDSKEIISKYFVGGSHELNVAQIYFEEALKRKENPKTMFDELEVFIGRLTEENTLNEFFKSTEFKLYDKEANPNRYVELEKEDLYSLGVITYQMATGESIEGIKQFLEDREKCLKSIQNKEIMKFVDLATKTNVDERINIKQAKEMIPIVKKVILPKETKKSCFEL